MRGVATKTINLKIPNNETNGYADPNGSGQNCENYIIALVRDRVRQRGQHEEHRADRRPGRSGT